MIHSSFIADPIPPSNFAVEVKRTLYGHHVVCSWNYSSLTEAFNITMCGYRYPCDTANKDYSSSTEVYQHIFAIAPPLKPQSYFMHFSAIYKEFTSTTTQLQFLVGKLC